MGVLVEDWVSRALVECEILLQCMEGMFLHILLLIVPCLETSRSVLEGLGSGLLPRVRMGQPNHFCLQLFLAWNDSLTSSHYDPFGIRQFVEYLLEAD